MPTLLASLLVSAMLAAEPLPVGHRGLITEAPENSRAGFAACLALRLGFECDIRRSSDGELVILHDDTLDRTTAAKGSVAQQPWTTLQSVDIGSRFHPAFAGETIPRADDLLALLAAHPGGLLLADLKVDDAELAADVVAAAKRHKVLDRIVWIGLTITTADLRKRLRQADDAAQPAVLAQTPADLDAALADPSGRWAYLRFVPTAEQVRRVHEARRRVLIAGATVAGREHDNWKRAAEAGVDAILTDHPLEMRRHLREAK
jgi:glycerophosphoryl diester phosphodiesterase